MKPTTFPTLSAAVLAVALGLAACPAVRADEPALNSTPLLLANRSLAARGPVALSVAFEPSALHWAFETGFPLGLPQRNAAGEPVGLSSPWRLDAFVTASHDRQTTSNFTELGYTLRLEHARERSANWLGVSRGGSQWAGEPEALLRLGAGRAQMLGGVQAEVSWVSSSVLFHNDPRWPQLRTYQYATPGDSGKPDVLRDTTVSEPGDHPTLLNTAQGSLRWQFGRLALASVGGVSLSQDLRTRRWAQASAEWQLTKRVLFLASIGEQPASALAFNTVAHPRTMLGVQVAPWATRGWAMSNKLKPAANTWRTQVLEDGRVMVRVQCKDVSIVEIAGDFTDWKPVSLLRHRTGWWYETLVVPPGVHRVQLRLDGGAWQAPPGLPRADDGPGGPSGTWVVMPSEE